MIDSEKLSTEPYKGVRDFYPADWAHLQAMFTRVRDTLTRYGYEEYSASPLERAELYEAKTSEEIVNEQTYTFTDRGDRRVTLRPEMTPTLARMVAAKRRELPMPLRWFSIPNVFRYERPQRGRLREHYQLNVDLVGNVNRPQADMEILSLASAVLKSFGAKDEDFEIRINDRTLLFEACAVAGITGDARPKYMRLLDKKNKMPADEFASALKDISDTDPLKCIENAQDDSNTEIGKTMWHLKKYQERLSRDKSITNIKIDPTITRGFDYYTGMVFEVFDTNPENSRSLFGGGRYDGLVGLFGSEPVQAVGFGMGDVTLSDFLETHHLSISDGGAPTLFLGTVEMPDVTAVPDQKTAETIADELRAGGVSTFVNLSSKSIGDQIKEADRRGIPYFAAVGPDELASGKLRVKRLTDGEELELALADVPTFCTR